MLVRTTLLALLKQGTQRSGNAVACERCGKVLVPKRGSRRQRYCSNACKYAAKKARHQEQENNRKPAGALFSDALHRTLGASRSVENPLAISTTCRDENRGRGSPFEPVWRLPPVHRCPTRI